MGPLKSFAGAFVGFTVGSGLGIVAHPFCQYVNGQPNVESFIGVALLVDGCTALALGTYGASVGWKRGPFGSMQKMKDVGRKTLNVARLKMLEAARKRSDRS